ncbi:cobaltochelatase CobT-related protein [Vibrio rumoiensis]|uniref:Cobalamin biosynthesis protein CobT n=1 Tax=Vibrio rumoiensis 1S-45 TaxID=1188252 RepID=A0A1E5E2A7_9VIBR|nr:hypothetical protein [Vibrio rumoiensis]OEF25534.1 cobalamin biosynthesis protein CobT [Vibrio rumoiensis 1S-45]
MSERTARQKSYLDKSLSAARAISQVSALTYQDQRFYVGDQPVYFLGVHVNDLSFHSKFDMENDLFSLRGKADSISLRLRFSDQTLHLENRPKQDIERLIFDFCEQMRVERLSPDSLPGMKTNLRNNFFYWCQYQHQNGFTETRIGMLLFTCLLVLRSRLFGEAVHHNFEDLIESTRAGIVALIGHELRTLPKCRLNQSEYSTHARELALKIHRMVDEQQALQADQSQNKFEEDIKILSQLALIVDDDIEPSDLEISSSRQNKPIAESQDQYRIFTQEFDQVIQAQALVRDAQLDTFRLSLNHSLTQQHINQYRLASILSHTVKTLENTGHVYQQEEGTIDGKSLHQLITSPMKRQLFYQPSLRPVNHCSISFLLDCSGSMQKHASRTAMLMDTLLTATGLSHIPCEILGFTTSHWNGGKSYQSWLKKKPSNPGRLNDVRHIIFKAENTHWRKAKRSIAALMKADIFKEGIDGEAVNWACQRLKSQTAERKILVVLSDGCPMDTATNTSNHHLYLDNHLRRTIAHWKQNESIEIYGVGIGIDLSSYYAKNIIIDDHENDIFNVCRHIIGLFK